MGQLPALAASYSLSIFAAAWLPSRGCFSVHLLWSRSLHCPGVRTQWHLTPGTSARSPFLFLKANRTECSTTLNLRNCSSYLMFSVTFSCCTHTPNPFPAITGQITNDKTVACCKSFVIFQPFGAGMWTCWWGTNTHETQPRSWSCVWFLIALACFQLC